MYTQRELKSLCVSLRSARSWKIMLRIRFVTVTLTVTNKRIGNVKFKGLRRFSQRTPPYPVHAVAICFFFFNLSNRFFSVVHLLECLPLYLYFLMVIIIKTTESLCRVHEWIITFRLLICLNRYHGNHLVVFFELKTLTVRSSTYDTILSWLGVGWLAWHVNLFVCLPACLFFVLFVCCFFGLFVCCFLVCLFVCLFVWSISGGYYRIFAIRGRAKRYCCDILLERFAKTREITLQYYTLLHFIVRNFYGFDNVFSSYYTSLNLG